MKLIFKILTAPVVLVIDLFTLICIGMISFSGMLLRLVSGIIAILGVAVLATYSPKNGLILLTIAFLFSPMGIPMLAVWVLGRLQNISLGKSHPINGIIDALNNDRTGVMSI